MGNNGNSRRRWSEQEVNLLRSQYSDMPLCLLAQKLCRPVTAVRQRAYEMGLKTERFNYWSVNDERFLKKYFAGRSTHSIAKELGRSLQAVKGKAQRMGLKKA